MFEDHSEDTNPLHDAIRERLAQNDITVTDFIAVARGFNSDGTATLVYGTSPDETGVVVLGLLAKLTNFIHDVELGVEYEEQGE